MGITSVFNLQQIGEHATCGAGNLPCGFSYDPEEFMRQDSAFGCPILFAPRGFTIPLPTSHGGLCWRIPNSCGTHGKLSCLGLGYRLGGNHVRCYLPPLGFRWPNPVPLRRWYSPGIQFRLAGLRGAVVWLHDGYGQGHVRQLEGRRQSGGSLPRWPGKNRNAVGLLSHVRDGQCLLGLSIMFILGFRFDSDHYGHT